MKILNASCKAKQFEDEIFTMHDMASKNYAGYEKAIMQRRMELSVKQASITTSVQKISLSPQEPAPNFSSAF
jgi:hypothetical protein